MPVNMPEYVIESPDILLIDAIRVVPLPPYKVEPLDSLVIQVTGVLDREPIANIFNVDPNGTINLGVSYGTVSVVGKTLPEVKDEIESYLKKRFKSAEAVVALGASRGNQQIRGQHLCRPDGTVALGTYGSVRVAGLTIKQAKDAIEEFLGQFLLKPQISIDILAYNSKVYYIIFDGAASGESVVRLPITGNETVLDAIAKVNGLASVATNRHMWIARPGALDCPDDQILTIDWLAITRRGRIETNYQVLPGDRIFVSSQALIRADSGFARFFAPIERLFGITLLGYGTVSSLATPLGQNGGLGTGGFGGL
jgi:polysaccharide biosynthesis/export protein